MRTQRVAVRVGLLVAGTCILSASAQADYRRITFSAFSDESPDWSPDGQLVVFESHRPPTDSWDLYVIPETGGASAEIRITNDPGNDFWAAWSPAMTKIAFTSDRSGNRDIWVMDYPGDDSMALQLTTHPGVDSGPRWSPDGTQIVFTSDRSGNTDIWTIPATGGAATQITSHGARDEWPDWSPDGSQIAFMSSRSGGENLYVVPATGGTAVALTDHPALDTRPDWSPNGSTIAFESDRLGFREIWVVLATGGAAARVTAASGWDRCPSWSPDGSEIVFYSDMEPGQPAVWAVDYPTVDVPGNPGASLPRAALRQNQPNPFTPATSTRIRIDGLARGPLAVFDASGRQVRVLPPPGQTADGIDVVWDGRDAQGRLLPGGVYFYRFTDAGGTGQTRKAILVR